MERADRVRVLAALVGLAGACAPAGRSGGEDDTADEADSDPGEADDGSSFVDAAAGAGPSVDGGAPALLCGDLSATVRDFRRTHPDFETFTRDEVYTGIVASQLGPDGKPVYAHPGATPHTTGPETFADWYHDVPGVNQALPLIISLRETAPGIYAFDDDEFFPIDGMGFGGEGFNHNFHFTTEIHSTFVYAGGEVFTFRGDDDLWLFINGRLAIDLGGLHQPASQTVDLDARAGELGLTRGQRYPMDIFHAERHTIQSTFHIETTINCFVVE